MKSPRIPFLLPGLVLVLAGEVAGAHAPALRATPAQPAARSAQAKNAAPSVLQAARPAPQSATAPAKKLDLRGLPNLGAVTSRLYRGGQPAAEGFAALQKLGIEIVVNFRNEKDRVLGERGQVEALGMRYVSIPWRGFDHPENKQVAAFLDLVRANPQKKIFVHCRRGAERTGVMSAAYRIAVEGWTSEQALAEMEQYRFRGFWFRHLKKYIRNFPETLRTNPAFRARSPEPRATSP